MDYRTENRYCICYIVYTENVILSNVFNSILFPKTFDVMYVTTGTGCTLFSWEVQVCQSNLHSLIVEENENVPKKILTQTLDGPHPLGKLAKSMIQLETDTSGQCQHLDLTVNFPNEQRAKLSYRCVFHNPSCILILYHFFLASTFSKSYESFHSFIQSFSICYGLNWAPPPNPCVEALMPSVTVFQRAGLAGAVIWFR